MTFPGPKIMQISTK